MIEEEKINEEPRSLSFWKTTGDTEIIQKTEREIGYPCFIRPLNIDLEAAVSKADNVHQLRQGILRAFNHDDEIIVEEAN